MKIDALKKELGIDASEILFGISEQPAFNCTRIDKGIAAWSRFQKDIDGFCKDLKRIDTHEEAGAISEDIDQAICGLDIEREYEELRMACENLRAWGQQWKDLAKIMIHEKDDILDLLSDDIFLKLANRGKVALI